MPMLRFFALCLLLCAPALARADSTDSVARRERGGCNIHGCWPPGGGCNLHGCWRNGGGCNLHGCWNSPVGSCNLHGCSDYGVCNLHGCPPPPQRRPPNRPIGRSDYVQEVPAAPMVRHFDQAGMRFNYPAEFAVEVNSGAKGTYVTLSGPRSLSAYVMRLQTNRPPETVRSEFTNNFARDLLNRGLERRGTSAIVGEFRGGQRTGVRERLDNRDDLYIHDSFAWALLDGGVMLIFFTYKSGDSALAARYLPIITRSLE